MSLPCLTKPTMREKTPRIHAEGSSSLLARICLGRQSYGPATASHQNSELATDKDRFRLELDGIELLNPGTNPTGHFKNFMCSTPTSISNG